jgi:structural maintenance of chromosome 3 (chondroitin sulfate proteoglycan 6)
VVDNDDTASQLITAMNRERSGRVTFMPLNRLKSVNIQYPKANDAVPLLSKLTYDRTYQMAFEQVFARTVVCSDLATAAQYTRSHGLNGVTDSGDRVDRKGALTGGYHDNRRSRLDTVKQVKRWGEEYERDATRHTEVKDGLAKLEQQISQAMGEIQRIDAKRKAMVEDRGHQARQANWMLREVEQARQRLARLEGSLADDEAILKAASAKKAALEEELKTPLQQQLSPAEVQELETLSKNAEQQKQALLQASQSRQQVRPPCRVALTLPGCFRAQRAGDRAHREPPSPP